MMKILRIIKRTIKKSLLKLKQGFFNALGIYVECNICCHKAIKFNSDSWHLYCICPSCRSDIRQRLLMASFSFLDKFSFENVIKNKKILHFAPEKSLGKLIQKIAKDYRTADFLTEGYSYNNIDISDMKTIKNETFDCIIACDVLEHVPDDKSAIREVYRILNRGGYCIFTVPQKDNLKVTFEDLSITDKEERERVFGQFDHLRIYGDDFITMLENSGFEVTAVNESFFDEKIVAHYVLFPPILSKRELATNYRKIFFGYKK